MGRGEGTSSGWRQSWDWQEQGAPVLKEWRGDAVLESGKSCGLEMEM